MQKLSSLLVLALCLTFLSYTCHATTCNCAIATDLCCNDLNNNNGNPTCYNPNLYQCNGGNRLCPKGLLSCDKACYDPNQYSCSNGQLVQGRNPCSTNNGGCGNLACCPYGGGCYNPNHFECTPQGLFVKCFGIASNNPSVCFGHGQCIGLDICNCTGGYTGNACQTPPFDCNVNNGGCGGLACCPTGAPNDHCYNPNHRKCTAHGLVWNCFGVFADNPNVCSGHGQCVGLDSCSCTSEWTGFNCQNPSGCNCVIGTDQCCHDLNNNNGNPTCYNPQTHQCNDNGTRLCSKGFASCGKACYNPNQFQCVNGNLAPLDL